MSYEEITSKYRIDDICPEIDNELNGMFIDLLGDEFEMGIFPEPNPDNDDKFLVTVEITAEDATLDSEEAKQIKTAVEERLAYNLGDDWSAVQKHFDGVQIYFNEELV